MRKTLPAFLIGILCMILTAGIFIQLKTIRAADLSGLIQLTDSNLEKELLKLKAKNQELGWELEEKEEELENMRLSALSLGNDEYNLDKLKNYEYLLGLTDVEGDGIVVTLADNDKFDTSNSFASLYLSDSLVHDGNLVSIVNELKAAGAEAISINDKRVTENTAITCAGNVIQVNGEKVGSPFVIKAIGNKDLLYGELTKKNGTVYKLKSYGVITNVSKQDNIKITKRI